MAKYKLFLILFMISFFLGSSNAAYNVISFGAKADGKTDSTQAFSKAWSSACSSASPATINVPRGSFLVKPIVFLGPCKNKIVFQIAGTIVAPSNYWNMGSSGYWILFNKVSRVSIFGGTLDARGAGFWACRRAGKSCPPGARSISFLWSSNVVVSGLTSLNSQIIHVAVDQSSNVLIQNVKINAPSWSPNTDGVHVQSSTGVTISKSIIKTGDDCISIGPGSTNLWMERIACGPGHGISVGSLAESSNEAGVQNVTVTGAVFTGTENGVRIKSWARASNGFAKNIVFRNIVVKNVYNPIIIDQNYCPGGQSGCPHQNSGVQISRVKYVNIRGTSLSQAAMNFNCSWTHPCQGINLQNIKVTYYKGSATSYCKNAHGTSSGVVVPKSCL